MRAFLSWKAAHPVLWRKSMMALVMMGATLTAFYCGRLGGVARLEAQQTQPAVSLGGLGVRPQNAQQQGEYARRIVATMYDNVPITREELGEFLIARFGPERIEFLINRRIVEMHCQAKGIFVTDLEVDNQFKTELKEFGNLTPQDFTNQILKRFNKSLYEWKEDVIRPKLLMAKLCRPMVEVTQEDLTRAYEARYGPKVQCRMIAFAKNNTRMAEIWSKISASEAEFAQEAKSQYLAALAAKGGEIPPIHKNFGDGKNEADAKIEAAAFNLKPGQTTPLMEMPDGTYIVLKCDKHIMRDSTKSFDDVRLDLRKEMTEIKLAQKIPEYFAQLRKEAHPRVFITSQVRQEDLERSVVRELNSPASTPTIVQRPTGPAGN